jgi:thioredoxin 1
MGKSFTQIISGSQPVLVDFYASWCGPCKAMSPIIEDLAKKVQGKARVIKIDVDKNQEVAGRYGIRSVPTLMVFKNGKVVWKKGGVVQAHELERVLAQHN